MRLICNHRSVIWTFSCQFVFLINICIILLLFRRNSGLREPWLRVRDSEVAGERGRTGMASPEVFPAPLPPPSKSHGTCSSSVLPWTICPCVSLSSVNDTSLKFWWKMKDLWWIYVLVSEWGITFLKCFRQGFVVPTHNYVTNISPKFFTLFIVLEQKTSLDLTVMH
jgi:hypothetical protein